MMWHDEEYAEEEIDSEYDDVESDGDKGSEEDTSYSERHQKRSVDDLRSKIWSILEKFKKPVAFAFSAVNPSLPNPGLQILQHEVIGLPLSTHDAKIIISQASPSPFGMGEETLVDESVRKCWELNPAQFTLENPEWTEAMKTMVDSVSSGLGIEGGEEKIVAELNKLLLYEPGAFFKKHKDSEKAPAMFGTLVVCLPSAHKGGKLVLTHGDEKYEFETAGSSRFSTSFAGWYADITHEILPVTSGYRLMLTYNLIWRTDLKIPSYDMACGQAQKLCMLLQEYNLQIENEDSKYPPILLHKLSHKYTQANLKFNLLKPQDLSQVQTLSEVSAKLGFHIYLGTLKLKVERDDECSDFEEKSHDLKNLVELNGKLLVQNLECPDDCIIDPSPEGKRKADKEEHHGPTGNEGCPSTYWYYDTVVVLVPPSKQLDFVFQFSTEGKVIEPVFFKLMKTFSENKDKKHMLKQLCMLALKQKPYRNKYELNMNNEYSKTVLPFYQQAAATALDLGCLKLFDEACTKTKNEILLILDIPHRLGRLAADKGLATVKDQLMKGVCFASTIEKKVKFLESVSEGFEAALQDPSTSERANLKKWAGEALFESVSQFEMNTKADCISLVNLYKTVDWSLFASKTMPVIMKAVPVVRINFINEFMSTLQLKLTKEQSSFIGSIIDSIWTKFDFQSIQTESATAGKKIALTESELNTFLKNIVKIFSSDYQETTIIPAMLKSIPNASKKCSEQFVSLAHKILKNKLSTFKLSAKVVAPPASHKCLIQALLTKFLKENVGCEPQAPSNWSLPPRSSCSCPDCTVINKFLQDPTKQSLDFPCAERRRCHLYQNFTKHKKDVETTHEQDFDVGTIRTGSPFIWRITKHQDGYETKKSEWLRKVEATKRTLSILRKDELVNSKLETYLQPYHDSIMMVSIKDLPDLKSLVALPKIPEASHIVPHSLQNSTVQPSRKREGSKVEASEGQTIKRPKPGVDPLS
nr:PREDICTED: uncharacterized protein LOC109037434 isoform X1 [Bemisia tabaci]XP_018907644.1 PREDICTED: uncharacterized protein LOC109037434 isoform X1 [Bemisia tabaci]XP_018907645.1 PREDICTED: uncharacterized protein LOC109037434 isoform X1 [Bemisia tabaci]